jgi:hypothetical protein
MPTKRKVNKYIHILSQSAPLRIYNYCNYESVINWAYRPCRSSDGWSLSSHRVVSCGICGGRSGSRAGFLRVLQFPLPIIPPLLHTHHHLRTEADIIDQIMADVQSGLSPLHLKKLRKKKMGICLVSGSRPRWSFHKK